MVNDPLQLSRRHCVREVLRSGPHVFLTCGFADLVLAERKASSHHTASEEGCATNRRNSRLGRGRGRCAGVVTVPEIVSIM